MGLRAQLRRMLPGARAAVPAGLRRHVRALRSARGGGPVTLRPKLGRVLVLAPHPDDESLGCGGTMALLAEDGAEVRALFATDGEATRGAALAPEQIAERRRAEAAEAGRAVGATVDFLGLPDGGLSERTDELAARLRKAIEEYDPEAVFAPWLLDGTPDHGALARALAQALDPGGPEVWGYEVWTALAPNRIVDITSVIECKREALRAHETAGLALDLSAGEGLSRWRSLQGLGGRGWAEAFLAMPAADYTALAAELDGEPEAQ